jgi:lipoprotein-releasing system permease protein
MNPLWLTYRFLFSRRSESLVRTLARLGIAATFVSVFALIVVSSVMNGFNRNIHQRLLSVEPHLSIEDPESQDLERVRAWPEGAVETVSEFVESDVVLRTVDGLFSGAVARGYPATEDILASYDLAPNEVLMGQDLAQSLNLFQGDQITVIPPESLLLPSGEIPNLERVRIKALLRTNVASFDGKMMVFNRETSLLKITKGRQARRSANITLKNPEGASSLAQEFGQRAQTWSSRNSSLFFALKLEKMAMNSLLALSVLVTSFSVIMVLLIFISEKQKDVGLLMSLGLSKKRTQRLFGAVGFFLAALGTVGGVLMGLLVSLYLQRFPLRLLPEVYQDTSIPAQVRTGEVLVILTGVVILCALAAFIPVLRVLRTEPSDALRGSNAYRKIR